MTPSEKEALLKKFYSLYGFDKSSEEEEVDEDDDSDSSSSPKYKGNCRMIQVPEGVKWRRWAAYKLEGMPDEGWGDPRYIGCTPPKFRKGKKRNKDKKTPPPHNSVEKTSPQLENNQNNNKQ